MYNSIIIVNKNTIINSFINNEKNNELKPYLAQASSYPFPWRISKL